MSDAQWSNVCNHVDSCALTGAAAFFAGIPDAALIANGPIWCYFYALRHLESSCPNVASRFHCSQPDNSAVVYGTEECLSKLLQQLRQTAKPAVLLIENSCSIGLIGDDIAGIAAQIGFDCPVICLDSGGLNGGFQDGYRAAAREYFAKTVLAAPAAVRPRSVNLLGCSAAYYNAANDHAELVRLLTLAGYEVVASPGAGSTTAQIAKMRSAELNLVIQRELGEPLAMQLQELYGMPYLAALPPYGLDGTVAWLAAVNAAFAGSSRSNYAPWEQEADNAKRFLSAATLDMQRLWGDPWFDRVVVAAPSSTALGLSQALRCEWVDAGYLTTIIHGNAQPVAPSALSCSDETIHAAHGSSAVETALRRLNGGLLLGSGNEKARVQHLELHAVQTLQIALPVHDEILISDRPFMGLRGARFLYETIWNRYIEQQQLTALNHRCFCK